MKRGAVKYYEYGQTEIDYLLSQDPALGAAIQRIGMLKREITPDLFTALVHSIVGQQISIKAAQTIWSRMHDRFEPFTPASLAMADAEQIQSCGMSMRKAAYIRNIAQSIVDRQLDLDKLHGLPDEEAIRELKALNGVGEWTAEMLLLHSMERPDVVSWGDIAIRRGMMKLYGLSELSKAQFDQYRRRYSPYGTVASMYLWAISSE